MTTVLLLPGMTLNATIFPDLPHSCVAIDFNDAPPPSLDSRQEAESPGPDSPHVTGPGGMEPYVRELQRRLERSDEWQRADSRLVVAHSFGGMLALSWLLSGEDAANGIQGLVLVSTTAGPMYDVVQLRLARFGDRTFRVGVDHLMRFWNQPLVTRTVKRAMSGGTLDVEMVDFRTLKNPTDLAVDFAGWKNTDWRAMRSYRDAMFGYDVRTLLQQLRTRTIVLHGSEDALFEPDEGRSLAQGMPAAEFRLVPGARHALPLTHGHAVVEAVKDLAPATAG